MDIKRDKQASPDLSSDKIPSSWRSRKIASQYPLLSKATTLSTATTYLTPEFKLAWIKASSKVKSSIIELHRLSKRVTVSTWVLLSCFKGRKPTAKKFLKYSPKSPQDSLSTRMRRRWVMVRWTSRWLTRFSLLLQPRTGRKLPLN